MKTILFIFFFLLVTGSSFAQSNIDFEITPTGAYTTSNAVSGWTISSQNTPANCNTTTAWNSGSAEFSIVATPILSFPVIGTLPHSPLGGTRVARLNSTTANGSSTKLSTTIVPSASLSVIQIAFAGVWEDCSNICCEKSSFKLQLKNQAGNILSCSSLSLTPPTGSCSTTNLSYSLTSGVAWTNWQTKYVDLNSYINTPVTIEIISSDCNSNAHYGTLLFDVCVPFQINNYNPLIPPNWMFPSISNFEYCPLSSQAMACGPLGYTSYSWTAPMGSPPMPPSQSTLSCVTLYNPIVGTTYTLHLISPSGCYLTLTYMINLSSVSITAVGTSSSCINGSSGSATVATNGSGTGYLYNWINSANQVVGTHSIVTGLSPGVYTVNVTAAGSTSTTCGTATRTLTIGTVTPTLAHHLKPYCGTEAYLNTPGGSNFQWYAGSTAIPSNQGGTSPSYTVTSPTNGSIFNLSYTSSFGCEDSLQFTLIASPLGSVGISHNALICNGSTNGLAIISITPATGAPPGTNSFSVFSTGTTSAYSSSINPTASSTFTVSNLSAGTYSVNAFDGSCKYTTSFSVTPYLFDYTLTPASANVCDGSLTQASVLFSSPQMYAQYTYSWLPSSGVTGNTGINVIISNTVAGNPVTNIYTVVVTPTLVNCPLTKTLSITIYSYQPASVAAIPTLCSNASVYTISANPPGGNFNHNTNAILPGGFINPALCMPGLNIFTYSSFANTCISPVTGTFFINTLTTSVVNNSTVNCGNSTTLSASGGDTYLWSNGLTSSQIIFNAISTNIYTVIVTNTTSLCFKTHTVQVTVVPSLSLSALANYSLCAGNSTTLSASGANTYTWNTGVVSPTISVAPLTSTNYFVVGSDVLGCRSNTQQIQVNVYALPNILVAGNFSVCPGVETTLHAYNVYSTLWNTGASTNTIVVSPPVTTIYTVTGTDFYGCANTKTVMVVVEGCVGLEEAIENDLKINIYPNPTQEKLFVESDTEIKVVLSDALGRIILQEYFLKGIHTINIGDKIKGVYFLNVIAQKKNKTIKLIKVD